MDDSIKEGDAVVETNDNALPRLNLTNYSACVKSYDADVCNAQLPVVQN